MIFQSLLILYIALGLHRAWKIKDSSEQAQKNYQSVLIGTIILIALLFGAGTFDTLIQSLR